ncbi:hypothetical protein MYCTH_2084292 [Thermothelomyces thermophilus ATCC 42464]|uniref:Uncharacterized protein n=1 Tax=Thermothelomyces thermophilus (strain ATCC 42464 / BCRC 31852 / DSM 1799) TaxID=573729 RepID=G2QNY7_THET4|nr:uncharacterized protein MYCTH_2084292 [Thermothelomyces thermophilus ATCC 42464]AEO61308.1 hypothetical protein MYCTH_2084292 [Thermothelomyces thermophilus ATCC 42464]
MYRTKHFRWKLMHLWGISAHLGLVAAVAIGYLGQLGNPARPERWGRATTAAGTSRCTAVMAAGLDGGDTLDVGTHTLLRACLILGSLGFVINVALLAALLAVEPIKITLTEGEQHWRKQVVTFFGCLLNLLLAGAGFCLAVHLGVKAADSKLLIAPLVWTYFQAPLAFAVAVCDAFKNYREGKDLLD